MVLVNPVDSILNIFSPQATHKLATGQGPSNSSARPLQTTPNHRIAAQIQGCNVLVSVRTLDRRVDEPQLQTHWPSDPTSINK